MQIGNVDLNKLRGLVDKSVGLGREFLGTFTNNDALVREGEAQQAKGSERLKALRLEAEAQKAEAKADTHEQRQKSAQRLKESA